MNMAKPPKQNPASKSKGKSIAAGPSLFGDADQPSKIVPAKAKAVKTEPPAQSTAKPPDKSTGRRSAKTADATPLFSAADANESDVLSADAAATISAAPKAATNGKTPGDAKRSSGRAGVTAETMATKQRDISVSEFFAKNRHLLGFDNKRKALLTTVKEAVDNSLDACEEAGILPEIHVILDQFGEDRFRVTVRDNGPGIVRQQIPNVFGKLLYGSKFHRLKMSRGQQGIGISAAGMYGLLTTGKPIHVTSRTAANKPAHHFQIAIDTTKNKPDVVKDEEQEVSWEHGTEVSIELVASYNKGKQSVDEYIEQTAIANPHAQLFFRAPGGESREFPRASNDLPAETREIQPHPHGIELGVLMKMLKEPVVRGEPTRTLSGFMQERFSRVTTRVAQELCQAAGIKPTAKPHDLSLPEMEKLFQAMQTVKIMAPPTDCLAPIGVRALLAGLLKEVKAEFYTANTRDPSVYRGNPFLIECGIAFGGSLPADEPARVIRFANRVPLLYQQSACASFKSTLDVDWRNYGISQPGGSSPVGPLVVMIHMASVWVPFTSESKEAIADYDEIRKEMKLALQECGRKLGAYIRKRKRQKLEGERRSIFERYIQDLAEALSGITGAAQDRLIENLREAARMRTAEADVELDEDGKPIEKPAEPAEEPNTDETVVIVEANAAPEPAAAGLFDDPAATPTTGKRKRRVKSGGGE